MNDITKSIVEKVGCPYQVFEKGNPPKKVQDAYLAALEKGKKEGFTPVLVVSDDTLEEWLGILADEDYVKEEVLAEVTGRGEEILESRWAEYTGYCEEDGIDMEELEGEVDGGDALPALSAFLEFDEDEIQETILFEIPVANPWEVIAWVPMGGWNDCPPADEMMEVCKYWYEKYQAVPAVISHDVMEFYVGREIEAEDEAMELAKEHYAFCPDRVDQGTETGTIGEVAGSLMQSKVWYFWWD